MRYAILIALASGCGYPALGPAGGSDAGKDGPLDHDANLHPDAAMPDGPGHGCPAPASYAGPPTNNAADHYPGTNSTPEEYVFDGQLNNVVIADWLFLDLADTLGVFTNGLHTGTFTITGAELNYDSCGACVLVAAKCNNCNISDGSGTAEYYMATGGTLQINTLSPALAGTLTNVHFVHVSVDNTGANPTYHTTPLADGCTTTIPSLAFSQHVTNH